MATAMRIVMRMEKARLNLYIDGAVVREARESGLNISRFVEDKLAEHTRATRRQRWLEENREAIRAYNERVDRDGPILQDLWTF